MLPPKAQPLSAACCVGTAMEDPVSHSVICFKIWPLQGSGFLPVARSAGRTVR